MYLFNFKKYVKIKILKNFKKLNNLIIQQSKDSENRNIVVYLLGTLLFFHEKESDG